MGYDNTKLPIGNQGGPSETTLDWWKKLYEEAIADYGKKNELPEPKPHVYTAPTGTYKTTKGPVFMSQGPTDKEYLDALYPSGYTPPPAPAANVCECGAWSVGLPSHADWCPIYGTTLKPQPKETK